MTDASDGPVRELAEADADASEILRKQLPPLMRRSEQLGRPILTMLLGRAYERVMRTRQMPRAEDEPDKPG